MLRKLSVVLGLTTLAAAGYIAGAPRPALCQVIGYYCDSRNTRTGEACESTPDAAEFAALIALKDACGGACECGLGRCHVDNEFGELYCATCTGGEAVPIYANYPPISTPYQPTVEQLPNGGMRRLMTPVGG